MTLPAIEQHRVRLSNDMAQVICEKFVGPAAVAAAISLLRNPMGSILAHPETRALQFVEEAVAFAQAAGQLMGDGLTDETVAKLAAMPPQGPARRGRREGFHFSPRASAPYDRRGGPQQAGGL